MHGECIFSWDLYPITMFQKRFRQARNLQCYSVENWWELSFLRIMFCKEILNELDFIFMLELLVVELKVAKKSLLTVWCRC